METRTKSQTVKRQVALVEIGADLRVHALKLTEDVNASYLLVHEVIADALSKDAELAPRAALKDALLAQMSRKLAAGRIGHRVMP